MTSDLEQIAEEMGACENVGSGDGRHAKLLILVISWAERLRAWIAANQESPQRKAFVEAAANCCKIHLEYSEGPDVGNWLRRSSKEMLHAYRAMIEAEKVGNG